METNREIYKDKYFKYKNKYIEQKENSFESLLSIPNNSYPLIEPFYTNFLDVGSSHKLYYEQYGNINGIPFLFLHGGPGSGLGNKYCMRFDLKKIHLIGFDQRGAGRSLPSASITNNTTDDLIEDIEKLRKHLNISKWYLFGCSWGSTLSLLYSIRYPKSVLGMVIYGIFLGRPEDIDWLYKDNKVGNIYPEEWDKFIKDIPEDERNNLVEAYYKRINSTDVLIRNKFSLLWKDYESNCSDFVYNPVETKDVSKEKMQRIFSGARIENHYMKNKCFLKSDNFIIENIHKLKDIPIKIVQGQYDMVCPVDSSHELYKALLTVNPNVSYKVILANHDSYYQLSTNKLIKAINQLITH